MMYANQGYDYYNEGYLDPNQGDFDPYYEFAEDTESAQLRKEQAEKDRIEALESNRLYLKKIKKQCAFEDFTDLEHKQLFLFEVLIESLEVNSESVMGLTPSGENIQVYVTARAQFFNSPYLEISENNEYSSIQYSSNTEHNDYLQAVGNANAWNPTTTNNSSPAPTNSLSEDLNLGSANGEELSVEETELICDVKWENCNGKSSLFSMTAMEMITNLERYPVNIQVDRCVAQPGEESPGSEPIGYTSIRLPDEFSLSVIQSRKSGVVLPVTTVHKQTCDVRSVFGVKKGKMEVSVRLSAFGSVIITSVSADHQYTFQPTPTAPKVNDSEEKIPRSDLLKPLIAEEENTIGLNIMKELDCFQNPVMWKSGSQNCGCLNPSYSKTSNLRASEFDTNSLMKIPLSSEISLCRNINDPTDRSTLKRLPVDICDWHNLISFEMKNNPTCKCVCFVKEGEAHTNKKNDLMNKLKNGRSYQPMPPMTGLGLKPEPPDCQCPCPEIKKALKLQTISCSFLKPRK